MTWRAVLLASVLAFAGASAQAADTPLWLRYPAVSPDGSQIAFAYGGRLYLVPATGGEARLLTTSNIYATRPVWSPDGSQIAFAADRFGNLDVFITPLEGGGARRLTSHSGDDLPTGFSADGTLVLFGAERLGDATATFTLPSLSQHRQLYGVPVEGGRERMILPTLAHEAVEAAEGGRYLYEDQPGVEQPFRKHDLSSQARDLWLYEAAEGRHTKLTTFPGEDRDPVFAPGGSGFFYLSERSGSFNVWHQALDPAAAPTQVTFHDKHPVRSLSVSDGGDLVYSYDGELWRLPAGAPAPEKVAVHLARDELDQGSRFVTFSEGATEFAVSPSGREIAFVLRGEVFVVSSDGELSRRITTTPEEERGIDFSPDGRRLIYASEREGSWGLYETAIVRDEEPDFFDATLLSERQVLDTAAEEFQPLYSPDGERVAYLENRETIRVLDLESGESRTVLEGRYNYSYIDGDLWYDWSPDGRWLAASYAPNAYNADVALLDTQGNQPPTDITLNGYTDFAGSWSADGTMVLWLSDILGLRRSDSNPEQVDVLLAALTREAADRLTMSQKDYERLIAAEEDSDDMEEQAPVALELEGVEKRIFRLTPGSASIGFYYLTNDGETLLYVTTEVGGDGALLAAGYALQHRSGALEQIFSGLPVDYVAGEVSQDEQFLYLLSPWGFYKVSLADGGVETLSYLAEMSLDVVAERRQIFEHVWRLTLEKFYRPDLHGVDWAFYGEAYRRFLPHIANGRDFAELLSEMVGELNASHTGAGYRSGRADGDRTASLGLFYDHSYQGAGIKVARVLPDGPADKAGSRIAPGVVIQAVDGFAVGPEQDLHPFLNRKAGRPTRLTLTDPASGEVWDEVLLPITLWEESDLAYWLWIDERRQLVAELSGGRVGYVHLPAMDESAYQVAFANVFGRYRDTEALVVDVRFNRGGNLTNQLLTMLTGRQYVTWSPRGRDVGIEPPDRWTKPSLVLMNPASYSDGSFFPFAFRWLGVGPLVGDPVPGTGTAVWWETQQDPTLYYGIPQAGYRDMEGRWLENQQIEPDVAVTNPPEALAAGEDPQLAAAVKLLLEELGQ